MPLVGASFLRMVTSPNIFKPPAHIDEAIAFTDALLEQPGVFEHLGTLDTDFKKLLQRTQVTVLVAPAR